MNVIAEYQQRFDDIDTSAKLDSSANEADYKLAGAESQRNYDDAMGDVDVWASEQNLGLAKSAASAAKSASEKQYSALANVGRRQTGGGAFSKAFGGRNKINLGSVSGGLEAANNARLKGELDKVVSSKKADLAGDLAANKAYAEAARAAADAKTQADRNTKRSANKVDIDKMMEESRAAQKQAEADALELYGEATGVGNQRRRRSKVTGEVELSDYYGNFPA